jgi:hypothetical protein
MKLSAKSGFPSQQSIFFIDTKGSGCSWLGSCFVSISLKVIELVEININGFIFSII